MIKFVYSWMYIFFKWKYLYILHFKISVYLALIPLWNIVLRYRLLMFCRREEVEVLVDNTLLLQLDFTCYY